MSDVDDEEALKSQLFVIRLGELLDEGKTDDAEELFRAAFARGDVAKSLWEIVPVVASRLTSENATEKRELFATCERLLGVLARECNPKETLLLLIERMEDCRDSATFRSILGPLRESVLRVGPERAVDWCAESIRRYARVLPCPENVKPPNGEERTDATSTRLRGDYIAILSFLEPLVDSADAKTRNHLLALHLSLYGAPFCYLWHETNETNVTEAAEKGLAQVCALSGDFFKYHFVSEERSRGRRKRQAADEEEEEEGSTLTRILRNSNRVSDLAWANYYYYVLNTRTGLNNIPQVYNYRYLMHGIFYTANVFLNQPEYAAVRKGLKIVEAILARVEEESVSREVLEIPVHHDLFGSLTRVMIYCDSDEDRKFALKMFHAYVNIFDYRARYLVLLHLYETANHSGIFSLLTSIAKNSIIHCLETGSNVFSGERLERLMQRICHLPKGAYSDLVEISDEVIAALNLVRFLVIRDRRDETGIWKIISHIRNTYFLPLRQGIDLALNHWIMKIKDLEKQAHRAEKPRQRRSDDSDVTISVGGQTLPMMPVKEKIAFSRQALNAVHVIASILERVNECIDENSPEKIDRFGVRSLWTSRALLGIEANKENGLGTDSRSAGKESDEDYEKSIKRKILSASLNFVNEYGWSQQAISAGAESVGYPGIIHGMFPNGGAELVQHFYTSCNADLNNILKAEALAIDARPAGTKKTPESQIRDALEKRLRMVVPYKSTWPQALGLMALPPNVPTSLANILTLVDDICYYAGDRSVDFNWYTRRVVLAGIYKTTELYLLQDSSEDHRKTWEFMERRIEDAVQLNRVISVTSDLPPADKAFNRATEAASAAFITARNILGLNWNR